MINHLAANLLALHARIARETRDEPAPAASAEPIVAYRWTGVSMGASVVEHHCAAHPPDPREGGHVEPLATLDGWASTRSCVVCGKPLDTAGSAT